MDNKERAELGLREYVAATRKCLNCEKDFDSEWNGNRICPTCKEAQAASDEYMFSTDTGFVYDLTVSEILDQLQTTGNFEQNFLDHGFYDED